MPASLLRRFFLCYYSGMFAFPIITVVIGLSLLVFIHEAGHFFAAKLFGLLVEELGFGLPPRLWGKKIGETLYSLNWLPFGGFVKIYGERHFEEKAAVDRKRSFSHQKIWKRMLIVISGVLMNFILGWFLVSAVFLVGVPQSLAIAKVKQGSLAEQAGLKENDRVLGFKSVPELVKFIDEYKGKEVILRVRRNSEDLEIKVTPRLKVPEGEGNLGIHLVETGIPKTGFFKSLWEGLIMSLGIVKSIVRGIADLLAGIFTAKSVVEKFVGPVGIISMAIQASRDGLIHFIQLLAMISLNLAVFNIIPIPALDGGKLLFLVIEKFRGRPISVKTELVVTSASFMFLLVLILIVTFKDILTLR